MLEPVMTMLAEGVPWAFRVPLMSSVYEFKFTVTPLLIVRVTPMFTTVGPVRVVAVDHVVSWFMKTTSPVCAEPIPTKPNSGDVQIIKVKRSTATHLFLDMFIEI